MRNGGRRSRDRLWLSFRDGWPGRRRHGSSGSCRCLCGGRCCRRGDTRWSRFADCLLPASRCSLIARRCPLTAADVLHHVRLAHHATAAGARHLRQVHTFVCGESACARRSTGGYLPRGGSSGTGGCRRLMGLRRWRCRGCGCWSRRCCACGRFVQLAQHCPQRDDVAFLLFAPDEYAACGRWYLDRYLIRFEFDQGFAGRDSLSFLLEPTGNGGFDDRLTERWNLDRDHFRTLGAGRCCPRSLGLGAGE